VVGIVPKVRRAHRFFERGDFLFEGGDVKDTS
jgi:hypothetical protein